jgi:hypothetical protein
MEVAKNIIKMEITSTHLLPKASMNLKFLIMYLKREMKYTVLMILLLYKVITSFKVHSLSRSQANLRRVNTVAVLGGYN